VTSKPGDAASAGVAAFDFDGTLIDGDSFGRFLVRVVGPARLGRTLGVSAPLLVRAYGAGRRDGAKAALLARLLTGYPADRLADIGEAYGAELCRRVRPAMADRIAWHRDRGHRLVIVSASLEVYLLPFGRALGFDQVLATRLEVGEDGRLTGRLRGLNVRRAEKPARLRAWLAEELRGGTYQLWAYGDSIGDRELLAMADHPMRV